MSLGRIGGSAHNSNHKPSFAGPTPAVHKAPATGPVVTIRSDGESKAGHHRKSSWKLLPIGSKPKLQIRQETTITTSDEACDRENSATSHTSYGSQEVFPVRPQASKPRKPSVDQWGDPIDETSFRMELPRDVGREGWPSSSGKPTMTSFIDTSRSD